MKKTLITILIAITSSSLHAGISQRAHGFGYDWDRDQSTASTATGVVECSFHGWSPGDPGRNDRGEALRGAVIGRAVFDVNKGQPTSRELHFYTRNHNFDYTERTFDIIYTGATTRMAGQPRINNDSVSGGSGGGGGGGSNSGPYRFDHWSTWEFSISNIDELKYNTEAQGETFSAATQHSDHADFSMTHVAGGDWHEIVDGAVKSDHTVANGVGSLVAGGRMFGQWWGRFNRVNWDGSAPYSWDGGEYTCKQVASNPQRSIQTEPVQSRTNRTSPTPMTPEIYDYIYDIDTSKPLRIESKDSGGLYRTFKQTPSSAASEAGQNLLEKKAEDIKKEGGGSCGILTLLPLLVFRRMRI